MWSIKFWKSDNNFKILPWQPSIRVVNQHSNGKLRERIKCEIAGRTTGITVTLRGLKSKVHSRSQGRLTRCGVQLESVFQVPSHASHLRPSDYSCKATHEPNNIKTASCWLRQKNNWTITQYSKSVVSHHSKEERIIVSIHVGLLWSIKSKLCVKQEILENKVKAAISQPVLP